MDPIIIIGSGLAGYNVAKELRKLDKAIPLTIISADSGTFYSKPMLSNALATNKSAAQIAVSSAEQMAAQLQATVRPHTRVTAIDPEQHRIRVGDEELRYAKLVLACGAEQIRLPVGGDAESAILTVNDLEDYDRFRQAIAGKRGIVVIGAGLIGCEFANDLAATGLAVHVVDIAQHPLARLLPPEGGAMMKAKLAELGVNWHFGVSVTAVDHNGDRLRITLKDGSTLDADVVLSAIGLRPRTAAAAAAGLKVNRGIVVDRLLQTSAPDIYALGDCAEVDGLVLPYVMPIMHAARALAATLAGKPMRVSYPAMPVLVKTPACPTIVSAPPVGASGNWAVEQLAGGVRALFKDPAGTLLGFALNGTVTAERAQLAKTLPPVLV